MGNKRKKLEVKPSDIRMGDVASINYKGELVDKGAEQVYIHYGYDGWNDIGDLPMRKQDDGSFQVQIKAIGTTEIDMCFRDDNNQWDNNDGIDYRIGIDEDY
ncbi:MAG: carbohydrate-binding protein [Bacillota bacterium]|nr:carbohydrate-binding protein [Bacillota bacterium]